MSKLPALKPRDVVKILENAGFIFIRQKGSHKIYIKNNLRVTIPYHNKDLRKKTLKHIIEQSGFNVKSFLELL